MERTTHNLVQGSPDWKAFRATHFGASEAAAAMGISPYMTRAQLMHQKATGESPEVSPALQAVFDRGHETEAKARPIAEEIIGDDLFPVTMSYGKLSASSDGLTMDESTGFEHKQWNAELADSVRAGVLPDHHKPQCQQSLFVTGAKRMLFMVSDGTRDNCAWMWVAPDAEYQKKIIAAWNQFDEDLKHYVPPVVTAAPVAAPQETLPAVAVTVSGSIAIRDNLGAFGEALRAYVGRMNHNPETDDDFATLDQQAKDLKAAEDALTAAENNAIGQASDLDTLRRTIAQYRDIAKQARLMAEKTVKAEKENRKNAIIKAGIDTLAAYKQALIARFPMSMNMPDLPCDFYGAAKGLRTIASVQNAVDTELARAKIAASQEADRIAANLNAIKAAGRPELFVDYRALAINPAEALAAIIENRVSAALKREAEERERIEREAREKAEREAAAKIEAERKAAEAAEVAARSAQATVANGASNTPNASLSSAEVAAQTPTPDAAPQDPVVASVILPGGGAVVPAHIEARATQADDGNRIKLGEICDRLGFTVTTQFLHQLGYPVVAMDKNARLYREADFHDICDAIAAHCMRVGGLKKAA